MPNPEVIGRLDSGNGYIETLLPEGGGEVYYRTCVAGMCRYSSDLWQADIYLQQMLGRDR